MATTRSLYLVRHAIAAERGPKWPDDALRPLTQAGAARMRLVAAGLARLGVEPGVVLTSPLVRAKQTAEILSRAFIPPPKIVVLPLLAPGGAPSKVAEALGTYRSRENVALVGHEPDLGELGAWLTGARLPIVFKKGGTCRIDVEEWPPARRGQLVFHATPRMLRALGKKRQA